MNPLEAIWARVSAHLTHAASLVSGQDLTEFHSYLSHNELELAANTLVELEDKVDTLPVEFWRRLEYAFEDMGLKVSATRCRYRIREAENGFVEALLELLPTQSGGRSNPVWDDYRPDWNIGNLSEAGEQEINGAAITLEDCQSIAPGGSGTVRLHPTWPEAWLRLSVGAEIDMHEGSRVVGRGLVVRVALRKPDAEGR